MCLINHLVYIIFKILRKFSSTCDLKEHYDCSIIHDKIEEECYQPVQCGGSGSIFLSKQDFRLGFKPLVCFLSLAELFPSCVPLEIIFHIILIMFHITFSSWRNFTKSKLALNYVNQVSYKSYPTLPLAEPHLNSRTPSNILQKYQRYGNTVRKSHQSIVG